MAHNPRPLEVVTIDMHGLVREFTQEAWEDGEIDARERYWISRLENKVRRLSHINAKRAFWDYLERLEEDDEISAYGQQKAAQADLHVTHLDDHREPPSKIVPFPSKQNERA